MSSKRFDVAVVGGGPAGGLAAGSIAKAGYAVCIVEEHLKPGEPVQCAGLITPRCFDIVNHAKGSILSKITGAEIFSPGGQAVRIGGGRIQAMAMDRAAFDRAMMESAEDAGCEVITGERVTGISIGKACEIKTASGQISSSIVVGADGARSTTREILGLGRPKYFLSGLSADFKGIRMEPDTVKVFFGNGLAPNFFAWMIPAGDVTRVGLCIRGNQGTVHWHFKRMLKSQAVGPHLKGGRILGLHTGLIPLGQLRKTHGERAMLVGDAACQVKATSGGGIYPGLVCAGHCAAAAISALEAEDFSAKRLSRYHKAWSADIGDELKKAMMMHRVLASLSDSQLDEITGMLARPEVVEVINRVGDIDYPSRLAWMLLRKEPRLLRYTGKVLRHGIMDL